MLAPTTTSLTSRQGELLNDFIDTVVDHMDVLDSFGVRLDEYKQAALIVEVELSAPDTWVARGLVEKGLLVPASALDVYRLSETGVDRLVEKLESAAVQSQASHNRQRP